MAEHRYKNFSIVLLFLCFLGSCSTTTDTTSLDGLKQLKGKAVRSINNANYQLRADALKETAMSTGAQAGLAQQSQNINQLLTKNEKILNRTFNFNVLVLDNNILPPVMVESNSTLNMSDSETIRFSDKTYGIIKQARFITTPPNWRDYLWMHQQFPENPDNAFLPQSNDEKKIWNKYVDEGWSLGFKQANFIFKENLARLKQDYEGMALYQRLLAQKIVSYPHVARTELGITGNKNELRINDQILRISALPELELRSKKWKPVLPQ